MTSRAVDIVSPRFLDARSLIKLEEKMASLIQRNRKQYDFYFFQQLSNGRFVVWYREELKLSFTKHLQERKT